MPFVQAKCPECGGMLAVDDSKKAAVCQFCGEAFIVQNAINNYNTYNTYNNDNRVTNNNDNRVTNNYEDGAVVNVYENQKSVSAIMNRAFMFLEEGDFFRADEYLEKALDLEPENAQAYLGKLMVDLKVKKQDSLYHCKAPFDKNDNYQKILRFGSAELKEELQNYINLIKTRNENIRLERERIAEKNRRDAEQKNVNLLSLINFFLTELQQVKKLRLF